ncbi:MAG: ABC transporter transmembrane domain-containing protein, partial [Pseudomonadota bacterium]
MNQFKRIGVWLGTLIPPFTPAEGPPPQTLWAFIKWCLSGAWPMILLAAAFSGLAGLMEVVSAWFLGVMIDSTAGDSVTYLADNALLIAAYIAFYLLIRPLFFGLSAAFTGIVLPPNLAPLIQSRLHRWTLGHDVTFFDNDFAGRIAQKQAQSASALVNVVQEVISAAVYAVITIIGTVGLLVIIDWRIAVMLVVWMGVYAALLRWYLPRIRIRAKARAAAR